MALTPIWPKATDIDANGALTFHGRTAAQLLDEFGSPLYLIDTDEVTERARTFVAAAAEAFSTSTTHVSFAGKAFLSKEIVRLVTSAGMLVDTCSMGEMRIALAAGVPGRRLVLHGNNKSDEEIALAVEQGFAKIVVDSPDELARIATIAHRLGKRAKVMLRVTCGIHAGGHEYISTAHEDQKFGVPLLAAGADATLLDVLDDIVISSNEQRGALFVTASSDSVASVAWGIEVFGRGGAAVEKSWGKISPLASLGRNDNEGADNGRTLQYDLKYPYDLSHEQISSADKALAAAMETVADGPALAVLKDIHSRGADLELVGIHSHIGSNIHDADAFIQAAKRMMLLRKTFYATDAYTLPEVDLGGGYSVAYTDGEDSMDVRAELKRLAEAVGAINRTLGMPAPAISFEPGRWIAAPAGVTLYRVGTIKPVHLTDAKDAQGNPIDERVYVSVDGGMSDNIRPALYTADYTARLANREGAPETKLSRVVGMHCESGDIVVRECQLPADITRGDILAVPVTGAYGRTMASNYNQAPIPAVVAVSESGAHVMLRRQTIDDLLALDVSE